MHNVTHAGIPARLTVRPVSRAHSSARGCTAWGTSPLRCLSNMTDQDRPRENPSSADWDTLARYIAGECTPDESREMARVLEADPARASLLYALDEAVRAPDPTPPAAAEIEAALASVRARAADTPSRTGSQRASVISLDSYRSRWRDMRFAAAAAVLVVAGAGLIWRAS